MKNLTQASAIVVSAVSLFAFSLHADPVWDGGGGDGNASNGLNWVGDTPPAATGESITFAGSSQTSVNNDLFTQLNSVTFAAGAASFSVSGDSLGNFPSSIDIFTNDSLNAQNFGLGFGLTGSLGNEGGLVGVGGSHLTLSGNISGTGLRLERSNDSGLAQFTLSGNNTFTAQTVIGTMTRLNIGSANGAGDGAIIRVNTANSQFDNTSGGAITINNMLRFDRGGEFVGTDSVTTTGGLLLRRNLTTGESLTVSGSSLTIRDSFTQSDNNHTLVTDGAGDLIFASDVVTTASWVGGMQVTQGGLFVHSNMSANTGSLTVDAGTVFGGAGSYGGAATISGSLRPGDGIGTFTMGNAVTWNGSVGNAWVFELGAGNAADLLAITGATGQFLKGSGDNFVFDFGGAGFVGNFTLIDWSSEDDLGGGALGTTFDLADFSYINLAGDYEGTFFFDGTSLNIAVIPEPAAMAGAFAAIALLVVALRRRRG